MESTVGTKTVLWATIGSELLVVVYDLRYMLICSVALILADLWWGYSESHIRYKHALKINKAVLIDKYRWHKSRALRRTANKLIDYMTYLVCGALIGLAITEPTGTCNHKVTAALGLGLGCICEIASITGHVIFVKLGMEISTMEAWRWFAKMLGRLIKIKSEEIGDAVEELGDMKERKEE